MNPTELRELAEKATPGPWTALGHSRCNSGRDDGGYNKVWVFHIAQSQTGRVIDYFAIRKDPAEPKPPPTPDCAYIAAADPSTVIALLDRLEAAEALLRDAIDCAGWTMEDGVEWTRRTTAFLGESQP